MRFLCYGDAEDVHTPIILGRPCLVIARALIDVKHGKLSLNVGEDKAKFELHKVMHVPSLGDSCYYIDVAARWKNVSLMEDRDGNSP